MNTFVCLGRCQGLQVEARLASQVSLQDFRLAVERACLETGHTNNCPHQSFLVVSYSRKVLKQTGDGHFSPVAAYDKASDQVLILDTARFKYGPHWVPLDLLYQAMQPIDPDTNKSRGFVSLSFMGNDDEAQPPRSILFQSKNFKNQARLEYKQFLDSTKAPVSWDQTLSFWTKHGTDPTLVWQAVQPQNTNGIAREVEALRALVRQLIPSLQLPIAAQSVNGTERTICQTAAGEAIFIMHLAALSPESRRKLVFDENILASEEARQQLLAESELVKYAIDVSDGVECISECKACESTKH